MNRRHRNRNAPAVALMAVLWAVAPAPARGADATGRIWPVPVEPGVASSFCEYRDGHLHAGVDVRTYGREGVPCLAAADGYVSRVRCTPRGYGKAVYIHLDSGETLVYAHLAEFAPGIDSLVIAQQRRAARYSVDFRPRAGQIRVKQGDVIGYSGSTGGVDPHLHFEVRNKREHPLDPFEHGFALPDSLRPAFERVVFVPLDRNARINGGCFPAEYEVREVAPGRYVLDDTVNVAGAVGVQALCVDYLNENSGRLAPRTLSVHAGDTEISHIDFQAISFGQSGQQGFVYDEGRIRNERRYYYQLYEREGETLWNRRFTNEGRLPGAESGLNGYELRVTATDVAGNAATVTAPVHLSGKFREAATVPYRSELGPVYVYGDILVMQGAPDRDVLERVALGAWPASPDSAMWGITSRQLFIEAHPTAYSIDSPDGGEMVVLAGEPGNSREVRVKLLGICLGIDSRTMYGRSLVVVQGDPASTETLGGAVVCTDPVRIGPNSMTLRADMEIRFSVPGADSTTAVYRQSERSRKWVHYASVVENDTVSTTAKRPGVYAVFSDTTAPVIREPRVTSRPHYATGGRLRQFSIQLEDGGSGIDHRRCVVFVNGIKQIAEWDGRAKKLFVLLRDKSIIGPQALTVVAYDNVGHRTQLDTTVVVKTP